MLLVTRNAIAAHHMIGIRTILGRNESVDIFATTDRVPNRGFDRYQAATNTKATSIHILVALCRHWDLVVFTNHPYGFGLCFPSWIKKLYVNHGIHMGKINNTEHEDGVYGRCKTIRPFSTPYYDCMFAASDWERAFAIQQTPQLRDRIVVTGFLQADQFLAFAKTLRAREHGRTASLPQKKRVHIISTWGTHSLYSTKGRWILQQIAEHRQHYDFVVSIHPRFDSLSGGHGETRDQILAAFRAAGATTNDGLGWQECVANADIAVSDHSSLCLYHVLLNHPVLLTAVTGDQYVKGSTFDLLQQHSCNLANFDNLHSALTTATAQHTPQSHDEIIARMLDYRGRSDTRYSQELETLLDISGGLANA